MGIGTMLLAGVVIGAVTYTVVVIARLTIKKLKDLIKKRKEKKEKQKVAFGKTHKILDDDAKRILEDAPTMTMSDLEKFCDENPYFVVDYDSDTDSATDFETIQTEQADEKVDDLIREKGVILFD